MAEIAKKTISRGKSQNKKRDYIHAVGRRKTAVARVRLYQKKGKILVNNRPIEEYFPGEIAERKYLEPLRTANMLERVSATITVAGSGKIGQLEAVVHGLSRALVKLNEEARPGLKKRGFLTRDPRKKERRKVGTGGKARRKKQSPKR